MIVHILVEMVSGDTLAVFSTRERAVLYRGAVMHIHRDEVYECFKKKLPLPKKFYIIREEMVL